MARPEAGLWDFLRARMPAGGHYSRIESNETCPGFPDVQYTLEGQTGGMELKCNQFPTNEFPFAGEKHGLRRSQKIWIKDELIAGGKVILVLQAREMVYFVEGFYCDHIEKWNEADLLKNCSLVWDRKLSANVEALANFMRRRPV